MSADFSSSATPNMDLGTRSERPPKQGLGHSFTFSTPQPNAGKPAGRKRARTLESPTDSGTGTPEDDAAKVKGGHSLRKRARIDYAQMAEDDDHIYHPAAEDAQPQEITVSGARAARKRAKPPTDVVHDEPEEQLQAATVPTKKRAPRSDKQRTASPVPQRRPYTKRKSIVSATAPVEEPSPEQQPSDTELKDTIEVGAPLAMQFTSSSSNGQPSETASNGSGRSPSQNGTQAIILRTGASSPTMLRLKVTAAAGAHEGRTADDHGTAPVHEHTPVSREEGDNNEKPSAADIQDDSKKHVTSHSTEVANSMHNVNGYGSPKATEDQNPSKDKSETAPAEGEGADSETSQDVTEQSVHNDDDTNQLQASEPAPDPISPARESVDSDATEIVPPSVAKPRPASPESQKPLLPPQQTRLTLRKTKQPAPTSVPTLESQQPEETDENQDSQKPALRPRVSFMF